MEDLMIKPKKRAITYGKAARNNVYAKPVDLDSEEEELISTNNRSKLLSQKPNKVPTKTPRRLKPVTPPISPATSIASPASSSGTKRASPFSDGPVGERSSKVRVVSRSSTRTPEDDIFDEIVPKVRAARRKPVPKLKKNDLPRAHTSDDTQIMLDNQLQEYLHEESIAEDSGCALAPSTASMPAKKGGLKMPTRTRMIPGAAAIILNKKLIQTQAIPVQAKSITVTSLRKVADASTTKKSMRRPRTPENLSASQPPLTVLSPSNLDLEDLSFSASQPRRIQTPESLTMAMLPTSPSKASPARPKLKDRLTSDLTNMINDIDTTMEDTIISAETSFVSKADHTSSCDSRADNRDSQQSVSLSQPSQVQANKITYGATRWTFLPDDEDDEMAGIEPIFDSQDSSQGKRSRQLPTLAKAPSKVDEFELEDEDDEPSAVMRSLHELKQAGGTQRMARQIEALLDDIEKSTSKAQRISCLLELISKLQQASFLRQFVDTSSEARLLAVMHMMDNLVLKTLFSIAFLLLLQGPNLSTVSIGMDPAPLSAFLTGMLKANSDFVLAATLRRSGAIKDNHKQIEGLCRSLLVAPIWSGLTPTILTPRMIALTSMERLVRKLRESEYQSELLHGSASEDLVEIISEWQTDADQDTLLSTTTALSVLESASLSYSSAAPIQSTSWTATAGKSLIAFCSRLHRSGDLATDANLIFLTLRLCLNLSNADSDTYTPFANAEFISSILGTTNMLFSRLSNKEQSDQNIILDNLVLSLGLLINLAEKSSAARDLFVHDTEQDELPIQVLLQIFVSRLQSAFEVTSEDEIRSNVPFGYLAVLLGYLCRNHVILDRVRKQLDGGNLRVLLIAIGEFLQYHQQVEELGQNEGGQEITIPFVNRLQDLMNDLRARDSDGRTA